MMMHPVLLFMLLYSLLVGPQEQKQAEPIQIVSIRAIARKNGLNKDFVWRKFKWYSEIYKNSPQHVVYGPDGRKYPTQKFVEFLEQVLGRKIVL